MGRTRLRTKRTPIRVSIPENPAVTPVKFETDAGWVTMKLVGSDDVEPEVEGTEVTFTDLAPAADEVTLTVTDTGVKETITLDTAPTDAITFRYALGVSPGITPALTANNQIEFRDVAGTVQFRMPVPNMQDSVVPEPAYTNAVAYGLAQTGSGWRLTVTPDMGWLSDPGRVYPIVIDPSVDKGDQKDCWIQDDMPNSSRCNAPYIYAGKAAGSLRRGLLDFGVDSLPAGAIVNDANLFLFLDSNAMTGSDGATSFGLFQPNDNWAEGASWVHSGRTPWSNGGASDARLSPTSPVLSGSTASQWVQWNVAGTVRNWRDGSWINRGFMLRSDDEARSKQVGFLSGTNELTQWRPILRIDYSDNRSPSPPSGLSASPGTGRSTTSLVPTLSADVSDPDGGTLNATFTIFRNGNAVWSSTVVAGSGSRASTTVPSGVLINRKLFRVRVAASDGNATSYNTRSDLFIAASGRDDSAIDLSGDVTPESSEQISAPSDGPYVLRGYAGSPAASRVGGYWDSICPGDGVEDDDRYNHISRYPRYDADPVMTEADAILYCGMSEDSYPEHEFGLRHVRKAHREQYKDFAAIGGISDWGSVMDFENRALLDNPARVVKKNDETRFCYEGYATFQSINGSYIKRTAVVILGRTGQRIMTSFIRNSSASYCLGQQGWHLIYTK